MLKRIKQNALKSLKTSGVFAVTRKSVWRRDRLLILAYHGISIEDEDDWDMALYMRPDALRARFEMIRSGGYTVLPLTEAADRLRKGMLPEKAVAITFDDGNYDFYKKAFPLIREFGFPVTVYLTTYYSLYNKPVFDSACQYILWKGRDKIFDTREIAGQDVKFDLKMNASREAANWALAEYAEQNNFSGEEKNELLVKLARQLNVDYDLILEKRLFHIMKPDEVAEIAAHGVDVQLHTHRHRTPLNRELFQREIADNRRVIEGITGQPTTHFCYPSGVYEKEFLAWLKEMNVQTATTCNPGIASRASGSLLLPRIVDSSSLSPVEFEAWLTGVASILPQRAGWGHRPQEG